MVIHHSSNAPLWGSTSLHTHTAGFTPTTCTHIDDQHIVKNFLAEGQKNDLSTFHT